MPYTDPYIFTSARLGFRNWRADDLDAMAAINGDEQVMEFFPGVQDRERTAAFIQRMQQQYADKGFCYFAVDKLEDGQFIGFTGLCEQTYPAPFTPCVDIGWRISAKEWNKGYASEAAIRCLQFAFETLQLKTVYAVAPLVNTKSQRIMQKAGMCFQYEFEHPLLQDQERLKPCAVYRTQQR